MLLEPENVTLGKNLAICYWKSNENQKSLDLLNNIINSNPNNLEVLADITDAMIFDLKESKQSTGLLTQLQHSAPSMPKVQKMSAFTAEMNGNHSKAIALYESSFREDPNDYITIKNLGSLLIEQKMWAKSIAHFRAALEFHPNEAYFLERLGTLLITCQDTSLRDIPEGQEFAERAFLHHIRQPPIIISAGRSLAYAYSMQGDNRNALAITNTILLMARQINLPPQNLEDLETMQKQFQRSIQ